MYLLVSIVVMAFLLPLPAPGVRLTSDADEGRPVPPEPIPIPPPPIPLPGTNPLIRLIERVTVEGPYVERGLAVFTLVSREPETHLNYLTFDEGIASGQIVVQELGTGSVPTLQVRNLSDRWAFLLAGELVAGGKQSRTVREDTLLPPHSATWINLPVYCIEQHRWSAPGRFDSAKAAAPNALRSGLNQGYDQTRVWEEAKRAQESAGVTSPTGDVTTVYTDAKTAARIDEMTGRILRCIPRREYVGLVVAHGREIVSADLFANSALYSKLYEKVIRSHVVEMFDKDYPAHPTAGEARAFLDRVYRASFSRRPASNGVGQLLSVGGSGIAGQALEYEGRCIHAAMFPQVMGPIPMPHPVPER
jgi:hypothetical protein